MAMNNPFLVTKKPKPASTFSFGSELRRLFGSPLRALSTLGLVLLPLVLSLAGAIDFLQSWLYSVSHKGAADKRPAAFFVDCLTNKAAAKALCAGTKAGRSKMQFWPFVSDPSANAVDESNHFFGLPHLLSQPQPIWYGGLFLLALIAFIAIGNPNLSGIGPVLADAFGFKSKAKKGRPGQPQDQPNRAEQKFDGGELLPPARLKSHFDLALNWILGGTLLRQWAADPGYFYIPDQQLTGPKSLLKERPPYFLVSDILCTNLMIVAPQGSGKTFSVFRPAVRFMGRSKGCAIVWDSKGDDFDRANFDYNFDLEDFEHSFKLVVFSGKTPEEAGERLAEALIPELSEDKRYFSDVAKDALAGIVAGHFAVRGCYPELSEILLYINRDSESLQTLIEQIAEEVVDRDEAARLMSSLVSVQNLAEVKGDLLGNLRTALAPLTTPEIKRFLVANPDNTTGTLTHPTLTVEELLRHSGLIRLGLAVADRPRVAPILGRLILAQFVFAVLSPRCNRDILKLAIVDEAFNFVSLPICKGMAQARSNNAGFMLAFQTLSQIANDSMLETIFSLAGTKIVMSGVGNKDADRFAATFGKVWLEFTSHSTNAGHSTNTNTGGSRTAGSFMEFGPSSESGTSSKYTTNYGRSNSKSKSQNDNIQLHERSLFSAYEIRTLPRHHAIIESADTFGNRWQAQIIDMSHSTVQALETTFLAEASRLLPQDNSKKKKSKNEKPQLNRSQRASTEPGPQAGPGESEDEGDGGGGNWPKPGPRLGPGSGPAAPVLATQANQTLQNEPEAIAAPAGVRKLLISTSTPNQLEGGQAQPVKLPAQLQSRAAQTRIKFAVVAGNSAQPPTTNTYSQSSRPPASHKAAPGSSPAPTAPAPTWTSQARFKGLPSIGELTLTDHNTGATNKPAPAHWVRQQTDPDQPDQAVKAEANTTAPSTTTTPLPADHQIAVPTSGGAGVPVSQVSTDQGITARIHKDHTGDDSCETIVAASNEVEPTDPTPRRQEQFERIKQGLIAAGVAPREVEKLTNIALDNGRDYEYLKALAAQPKLNSLAAWLNYAITRNLPPITPANKKK